MPAAAVALLRCEPPGTTKALLPQGMATLLQLAGGDYGGDRGGPSGPLGCWPQVRAPSWRPGALVPHPGQHGG